MKTLFLQMVLLLLTWSSSCNEIYFPADTSVPFESKIREYNLTATQSDGPLSLDAIDSIISKGLLKLTLSIANSMAQTQLTTDNMVFAPINIGAVLALLLLGSAGKTFDEIANTLGLATGVNIRDKSQLVHEHFGRLLQRIDRSTDFELGEEVKIAAAIFVQDDFPIRRIYKQISENIYKSEVLNLDFEKNPTNAKNIINAWVNDRTKSKIKSILEEDPPTTTKIIIAGSLYFKAAWVSRFLVGETRKLPFYTNGRKNPPTSVDMMLNGGIFPYHRDYILDCEILGLPYKGNKSVMYIVVPTDSNKEKLLQLQMRLSPNEVDRLIGSAQYRSATVQFPKMKLLSSFDLTKVFKQLGIRSLFEPSQADLSLLSPGHIMNTAPSGNPGFVSNLVRNPISANVENDPSSILIFSRSGVPVNCTQIFDPASNISKCQEVDEQTSKQVIYKKFGDKVGRRVARSTYRYTGGRSRTTRQQSTGESLDALRAQIKSYENPGLYADQVLHKVYMDITETGVEATAATSTGLHRGGDIVTFLANVPFLFFIRNHETKTVLFWGAVNTPTPSYN